MTQRAAAAINFGASAAVLVLEILAGRLLAPYVGVSLETFTGIIGTVLAGIALGSAMGGRLADRYGARLLLGPTVALGGVFAFLALPVVSVLGPAADGSSGSIVMLALAAFFMPAAVLSAVSPMVAQLVLDDLGETGRVIGGLSAAGTAGALFGTFITGFVLVSAAPTRAVIVVVATLLCLTGLGMWIRFGGRAAGTTGRPGLLVFGVIGASAFAGLATSSSCEAETAYSCVTVIEDPDRPSGRTLLLDTARHSYVDLQDPTHLEFRYLRIVAAVIEAVPGQQATRSANGPLDALHIGGGAFTLPHYLAAERPGTTSMVLEIDGELVDIVEARLGLEISEQLQVQVGDARLAIRDIEPDSYDVVVGDAFSGMTVPWHLTTREMAADIRDVLRPDGVYVLNLIDGFDNKFGRSQVATLQEIFEFVEVIVPPDNRIDRASVNQVLVASTAPIPQYDVAPNDGVLFSGPAIVDFVAGARSLTDDWAPVDQLRTR
jgi:hypothetical protein